MMPPSPETKVVCPHCGVTFRSQWGQVHVSADADGRWWVRFAVCADCNRLIAFLQHYVTPALTEITEGAVPLPDVLVSERMIRPRAASRKPIPANVPKPVADAYDVACRVLPESAEASAAFSRRCLQNLLVAEAAVKKRDLFDQIQEVIDAGILPRTLAEDLDAVREIGNFGAHAIKSTSTGEIVPVEPGEADWNLDVLEALFEFFYAEPDRRRERRAALDEKLKAAGRKSLAEMRTKKP